MAEVRDNIDGAEHRVLQTQPHNNERTDKEKATGSDYSFSDDPEHILDTDREEIDRNFMASGVLGAFRRINDNEFGSQGKVASGFVEGMANKRVFIEVDSPNMAIFFEIYLKKIPTTEKIQYPDTQGKNRKTKKGRLVEKSIRDNDGNIIQKNTFFGLLSAVYYTTPSMVKNDRFGHLVGSGVVFRDYQFEIKDPEKDVRGSVDNPMSYFRPEHGKARGLIYRPHLEVGVEYLATEAARAAKFRIESDKDQFPDFIGS